MAGDPNYTKRVLGLHFDGVDNSTVFIDNSSPPKTVTANGNAKIVGNKGVFDGNGDYLEAANHADFNPGSGSFTLRGKLTLNSSALTTTQAVIFCGDPADGTGSLMTLYLGYYGTTESGGLASLAGKLSVTVFAGGAVGYAIPSLNTLAGNVEYDIEVSRSGNTLYFFINGVLQGTVAVSAALNFVATTVFRVGRYLNSVNRYFNGSLDEIYMWKGVVLNTANFTPPSVPYLDYQSQIAWQNNETIAAARFVARAYDLKTGALAGEKITGDQNFNIDIKTAAKACEVVIKPDYQIWEPNTLYSLDSYVYPTNPAATPYYYKRIAAGTSGTTEPAWVTTPGAQVNDGAQNNAWELMERLAQPTAQGPLIPS